MKFEVTLKQLREHKACVSGYNKVVCSLKKIPYVERETYIKFKHTEAIPLLSILESNGLDDALWCLRCNNVEWERDSRLFAVWCARQVQHLMTDKRSLEALDVAEAFANNNATLQDLYAARDAAFYAAWAARDAAFYAACDSARAAQKEMFIKMCNGEAPWQLEG